MLNNKTLADFANLFSLHNFLKNGKITLKYFLLIKPKNFPIDTMSQLKSSAKSSLNHMFVVLKYKNDRNEFIKWN